MTSTKSVSQRERATLRSVVRQQFRVLRDQVRAREAHLEVELKEDFERQYADHDVQMEKVKEESRKLAKEVNDLIRRRIATLQEKYPDIAIKSRYNEPVTDPVHVDDPRRRERFAAARARIPMLVRSAYLQLNTQEADLMLGLAKDSLASEEALAFIANLPERREVLPVSATLAEIEGAVLS